MTLRPALSTVVALLGVALLACPIEVRTRPDPDAAVPSTQVLQILTTKDDGQISSGKLFPSGETLWGNLIHVGSWATVTSGGPTLSYGFLRFRLTSALSATSTITSARVRVLGHAQTGNSRWNPTLHKLVVSADRGPDAAQVTSPDAAPGGAAGVTQTRTIDWAPTTWTPEAWNTSPNLAAIVQELVDTHRGLEDGAHLQLWLRAPTIYAENAELPFEDLDHANGRAAVLTLEWVD